MYTLYLENKPAVQDLVFAWRYVHQDVLLPHAVWVSYPPQTADKWEWRELILCWYEHSLLTLFLIFIFWLHLLFFFLFILLLPHGYVKHLANSGNLPLQFLLQLSQLISFDKLWRVASCSARMVSNDSSRLNNKRGEETATTRQVFSNPPRLFQAFL